VKEGLRANPLCSAVSTTTRFTLHNAQDFRGIPSWAPILRASDEEKLRAYSDPQVRKKLHHEAVEWNVEIPGKTMTKRWVDYTWVGNVALPKNKPLEGKTLRELAAFQNKGIIDAFLDLAVEEKLDTVFVRGAGNSDVEAMRQILNSPSAYV